MSVSMRIEGLEKLEQQFGSLPFVVRAGVKLTGPAVGWGLVWEFGSARISEPGPKTTWGTNPNGQKVVLTLQAPRGWIRVNRQRYVEFVLARMNAVNWAKYPVQSWRYVAADTLYKAAQDCAALMEETAPVDTGQLVSGIVAVNEPDPILDEGTFNAYGPTWLELN